MKVDLLYYTGMGMGGNFAADLMIFTKNTRIKMAPDGFRTIQSWPNDRRMAELEYMANTIRSSWEFVDYTFLLSDVTRAFTHQLVRTRHASYAQQTQQILKIAADHVEPPRNLDPSLEWIWQKGVNEMEDAYCGIIDGGGTVEQARGILPTNIRTNIVVKMNLRTVVEVFGQRISPRNLSEYSEVAREMRRIILDTHPWATVFLEQSTDKYLEALDEELKLLRDNRLTVQGNEEAATRAMKLVDQIRRNKPTQEGEE